MFCCGGLRGVDGRLAPGIGKRFEAGPGLGETTSARRRSTRLLSETAGAVAERAAGWEGRLELGERDAGLHVLRQTPRNHHRARRPTLPGGRSTNPPAPDVSACIGVSRRERRRSPRDLQRDGRAASSASLCSVGACRNPDVAVDSGFGPDDRRELRGRVVTRDVVDVDHRRLDVGVAHVGLDV